MNKLIRIFSYILMVLGALILLGGLGAGIFMLIARGAHVLQQPAPFMRMMGSGLAVTSGLRAMLEGLLVSGFGMVLYLMGEMVQSKRLTDPTPPIKTKPVK